MKCGWCGSKDSVTMQNPGGVDTPLCALCEAEHKAWKVGRLEKAPYGKNAADSVSFERSFTEVSGSSVFLLDTPDFASHMIVEVAKAAVKNWKFSPTMNTYLPLGQACGYGTRYRRITDEVVCFAAANKGVNVAISLRLERDKRNKQILGYINFHKFDHEISTEKKFIEYLSPDKSYLHLKSASCPQFNFGGDTLFCPGTEDTKENQLNRDYTYTWLPTNPVLVKYTAKVLATIRNFKVGGADGWTKKES